MDKSLFTYEAVDLTKNGTDSVVKNLEKVNKAVQKSTFMNPNSFQGWAMSLMFAGMAMERTAKSIRTFGTKAFDEITHSMEGATTQNDVLQGSMKYLGYTIGEALEPVISLLIPIIDNISEWVSTHPKLTAWGITLLGIVGTITMIGGMFTLAWVNGVLPFVNGIILYFPIIIGWLTKLWTEIGLTTTALSTMGVTGLLSLLGIIGGIIVAVAWLVKLSNEMGGFGELLNNFGRGAARVIVILGEAVAWLGNLIVSVVVEGINLLIKAINRLLENSLVQWGAKKLGINIKGIPSIPKSQYNWGDFMLNDLLLQETTPENGWKNISKNENNTSQSVNNYISIENINTKDAGELMEQLQRYAQQSTPSG